MSSDTLVLNTMGYQVSFEMETMPHLPDEFDVTVHFRLDPRLGNVAISSSPMPLSFKDLQRLATYFEQHITQLQAGDFSNFYTFVPLDLQFQLLADMGEVRSPEDGEFVLLFLINVGRAEEGNTSTYVGGQAEITLENVNLFLSSVARLLSNVTQ